jgi:DNA-binding GntR family transcriptional regulator
MGVSVGLMEKLSSITATLTKQVAQDILSGELQPGSRLKLQGLGQRYGTSAIPLREALARLANQGLVVFTDQKGFSVAPVSRADLIDLTETRIAVECLALRRAIERGDVEWETSIVSAAHRLSRIPTYIDDERRHLSPTWEAAHSEYHRSLIAGCESPRLLAMRDVLTDQSRRYRYLAGLYARAPREVDDDHRDLVAAVLDRDPEAATTLIARHFQETTDMILESEAKTFP